MSGQIFVPWVNRMLMVLVILAVLGFRSSDNLGAAYGIAVTGTMTMTTLLALVVARKRWHWSWFTVVLVGVLFLIIDLRSEEHTSELQSLMRISYAVFCLKK